jgi:hypothetical protein
MQFLALLCTLPSQNVGDPPSLIYTIQTLKTMMGKIPLSVLELSLFLTFLAEKFNT